MLDFILWILLVFIVLGFLTIVAVLLYILWSNVKANISEWIQSPFYRKIAILFISLLVIAVIGGFYAFVLSILGLLIIYFSFLFTKKLIKKVKSYWKTPNLIGSDINKITKSVIYWIAFILVLLVISIFLDSIEEIFTKVIHTIWFETPVKYVVKFIFVIFSWLATLVGSLLIGIGLASVPIFVINYFLRMISRIKDLPVLPLPPNNEFFELLSFISTVGITLYFSVWVWIMYFKDFLFSIQY